MGLLLVENKIRQYIMRKENYRPMSLMNMDAKIPEQMY
jgi:hypothetical protein